MTKIATSIEQSKRLMDAGLDPESADMCYANIELAPHYPRNLKLSARGYTETLEIFTETGFTKADVFPAWSLSRLIDLIADTGIPMNYGPMKNSDDVIAHAVNALEYQLQYANH